MAKASKRIHPFFQSNEFIQLKSHPRDRSALAAAMNKIREIKPEDREKISAQIAAVSVCWDARRAIEIILKTVSPKS